MFNKEFQTLINKIRNIEDKDIDWDSFMKTADKADPLWFEKQKEIESLYGININKIMQSKLYKLGFE